MCVFLVDVFACADPHITDGIEKLLVVSLKVRVLIFCGNWKVFIMEVCACLQRLLKLGEGGLSFESHFRVTRRNFQTKLQAKISDGIENYWLKVWLIASSIHKYENGLSNSKSQHIFKRVLLALLKTRNFCVYKIFCNELTNEEISSLQKSEKHTSENKLWFSIWKPIFIIMYAACN